MLRRAAHVYIGDAYIPRENWHRVRPKGGAVIYVRAFVPPHGKDMLRNVLMIGVAVAAIAFGGPLGAAAFGFLGPAVGAALGQAVIGIGGMLLVNALIPPRQPTQEAEDSPTRFIEAARNRSDPFGTVPVLFGRHKIVPQYGAAPITEIVGDDQYLRMLFTWGIGPMSLDSFKIGETLLTEFTDVEVEHRYGYPSDTPITLYPSVVDQQQFQITLVETDGYTTRTTADNVDEIAIDVLFPAGLLSVSEEGERSDASVAIMLQYSVTGSGVWEDIPTMGGARTFPDSWANIGGGAFNTVTFTHERTNAIRHGITWKVPARGQYDVRVKRATADSTSDTVRDVIMWSTLRSITDEHPVQSPVPIAMTALQIKASDQLSNVIDEFNGIGQTVCLDWNGSAWVEQPTSNPASLFRYALQNNGLQEPYSDDEIDLEQLEYWADFCTLNGFEFNQLRDFQSSLWDLLQDIAAAGRASRTMVNGLHSVVIDEAKSPVSHITPRNSSNFQAAKGFVDFPHAFRVQFNNEDEDWRNDELRVYLGDYTEETATKFELMNFPGVTNADLNARHARFAYLCAVHRPEQWTWTQDMERLAYRRGDVVLVTHDVLLVGLSYGRIKTVTTNGSGDCTEISIDEPCVMELSKSYGVSIRTASDVDVTASVQTIPGINRTLKFPTPIPAAQCPSVGDLYGFGLLGSETDKALILEVVPSGGENFSADVMAVPYREIIYTDDGGEIPPFDTKLTPITPVPEVVVEQVRSDESVLTVGPGESLSVHINVKVQPVTDITARLHVQTRPNATDERFIDAVVSSYVGNEVSIGDVRTGEYVDVRLRWVIPGRMPGEWTTIFGHRVVGKSNQPDPLQNMTISTFGGQAFIRWDKPKELDVLFGGEVRFRHSADIAPEWSNSVSIGDAAQARTLFATMPLKPGTYLARVFDEAGNQSTVVMVDAKQASVLQFANVDSIDEAPTFAGDKLDVAVTDSQLTISGGGMFDDIPDVDAESDIDVALSGAASIAGTYEFASGFDFLTVSRVRLTTRIIAINVSINDNIDAWEGNIDDRDDFDGADNADCDCIVYVRTTDDDPAGSPTWGEWQRLDSMEINARACEFKAELTSRNTDFNILVSELGVDAEEIV